MNERPALDSSRADRLRAPLVGSRAPEFTLPAARPDRESPAEVRLADYRDRWLVLCFYPRDFSLVCPTELTALSGRMGEFAERSCDLLGISTDTVATHEQWMSTPRAQGGLGGLRFPLASDPSGEVCRDYGVLVPRQNVALRGLFVVDPNGVIQHQTVHSLSVGRSVDELLRVLDALQSGGMCPEAWTPGQPFVDVRREMGINRVIGSYRIEAEIGRGAFGIVYRARDLVLDRDVALKVLKQDEANLADELLREARLAAALNHPNICTVHTVDASSGVPVIVMELVAGRPLGELLAEGPLVATAAYALAAQIAHGLAAAHEAGVVHGDLKPANILVRADGLAKLMDFGLARRLPLLRAPLDDTLAEVPSTNRGGITGTPFYLAPELARGEAATIASDVFSFGLILYELLTGHRAVVGNSLLEVLQMVEQLDVERLLAETRLDDADAQLLRKLLQRDAARRASSAELVNHAWPIPN